ncbi:carbohydrate binding domain-containing protein [Endozoicomonas sp. SM1973]|uniref:Carbohydrate binding domain-containing protein n=1 Tax=Spartinivicinus marinus TaxID=2994442 RepID=A0A853I1S6_9GAMM|nr:carbohydrate binding domain-containing protein [Spartinivicinus marinus]MCX4030067.1 carbohydrate binding domain-containing protein [Spartinivicinus marinus]NYZ64688.1 carbohydrate binding domain-containing protein [Spartinivicinus marinus]
MSSHIVTANEVVDGPVILDVMAVYTNNTAKNNDMAAKLSQFITYANKSYENSNINIKLRLVHHSALPQSEGFSDNLTGPLLKKLKNNEYVAELRAKHGADFVTLVGPSNQYCGLGYLPWGNGKTGKIDVNSKGVAYNWVSLDCTSSYAHELGHNMGLSHSRAQESRGSIFDWGVGHGVNGLFVTTMAYQSAYGNGKWVPRLQYFSNPNVYDCKGLACGVKNSEANSADAAQALNRVATQLAEFMPAAYATSQVNNNKTETTSNKTQTTNRKNTTTNKTQTTTTNTTETKVATRTVVNNKVCKKPEVKGNLIKNPEFSNNQHQYWGASYASQLNVETITKSCGKDQVLKVTNHQYGAGTYTKVTGLEVNKRYDFSVKVKLASSQNTRADTKVLLYIPGQKYVELDSQSVTDREFSQIKAQFTIKPGQAQQSNEAYLFVYIPRSGIPFMLDEAVVKQASHQPTVVKRKTPQVLLSNFESGLQSWHEGFRSKVSLSNLASEGRYGLAITQRPYWYSGAAYDVRGLLSHGQTYKVSANVKVTDTTVGHQYADMRLYYIDDSGHHWVVIKRQSVSAGQWHTINGTIKIMPKGKVRYQKLFLFGPQAGVNFAIDNVQIEQ